MSWARPQQIRLEDGGEWHQRRQDNGRDETKCGIHFGPDLVPATRPYKLDEFICKRCHSRHEIETGELRKIERDAIAKKEADEFETLGNEPRRRRPRDTDPILPPKSEDES